MAAKHVLLPALLLLVAGSAAADRPDGYLKLHGTVALLPRTEPCNGKRLRATVLYRVERVVQGSHGDDTILVIHRCPELARGPSRIGRGDAGAIKVGQTHLLELRPVEPAATDKGPTDPFVDDKRPRYKPLRTDPSNWPPRMVVVIRGGGGTHHKLPFDADELTVGRATHSDVMLGGRGVAIHHLRLVVRGDQVEVRPVGSARVLLNNRPMARPARITFKDRIGVGPYTLRVALFLDGGK